MKKCNEQCYPICDFCYNLERDLTDPHVYDIDESYCNIKKEMVGWTSRCEEFDCFRNHVDPEQKKRNKELTDDAWQKLKELSEQSKKKA